MEKGNGATMKVTPESFYSMSSLIWCIKIGFVLIVVFVMNIKRRNSQRNRKA